MGRQQECTIASDSYAAHVTPVKLWGGTAAACRRRPGRPPWPATRPQPLRAHLHAHVWARIIDGYSYIHYTQAHKSITIMLP